MAQQIYFSAKVPGITPNLPMTPHVPAPPSGESSGQRLLARAFGAGRQALDAYLAQRQRTEDCLVEDAWSEAQNRMREWRTEYQQSHKAGDAREAQAAFNSRWAEIAGQINDKYGGELSQRHRHLLARKMELGRIYADEDGAKYQEQQFRIWGQNQERNQLARLNEDIAADPYNLARHDMAIQEAVSAWESRNPGQDSGAFALGLRDKTQDAILNTLLAGQDYDGAEAMLRKFAGTGGPAEAGPASAPGGSVSSRNLAAHNYGNVKTKSGGFAAYASRHDGLMAIGERALRYSNAPDRGWHAQTLRQMVEIYAPASDGNKPDNYAAFLAKRLGVGPNEKIDFRDPQILAGLIQSMPIMEHGAKKVSISDEEAMRAAQALLAGEKPQSAGTVANAGETGAPGQMGAIPARFAKYVKAIEAGRKRQATEMRVAMDGALQDYFAACADGKGGEVPCSAAQIAAAYGEKAPEMLERMEQARSLNHDVRAMNDSDAATIAGLLKAAIPEEGERGYALKRGMLARRQEIAGQILTARQKDPAGYLMQRNPQLQQAYGAMLQNPTPESVSHYLTGLKTDADLLRLENVPIFPRGQVPALAAAIMESPNPGAVLQHWQNAFGSHWGKALQELSGKDGLPMAAKLAANDMPTPAARLLLQAAREKDFARNSLELHKSEFSKLDLELAVREAMRNFNQTLLAGADAKTATEINDAVSMLALQYVNQGSQFYKEAVKRAANEVILSRYSINSVNGGKFRVPARLDGNAVERGAGLALKEISAKPEELYAEDYRHLGERAPVYFGKLLRQAGHWVTAADESGLLLYRGDQLVRRKNGEPVLLGWADLARRGARLGQLVQDMSKKTGDPVTE